jgi:glycosyltransferase involved in cell wall biosynthesis
MPPLLLHAFSTFATGGPQVRFAAIANHLGGRYRHAIVAMDGNLACRERLDPALDVTFPDIPVAKGDTRGNARRFHAVLRAMRPDALLTSNWGTIEWAIANRLGTVRHVHVEDGFGPEERDRQIPRRVWMRRAFLAGREVVVPSLTLRRIATERWRLRRVRYVPNGIDLARFAATRGGEAPAAGPVIGTVAALRAEKNLARLLRAFAAGGAGARLVIAGDGPERPKLEALAAELGIADRTTFAGHMPDPAPLLRGLDVFALSSDTEQMPISLLEAMGAGLPVAATSVGDVAAMLAPEQAPFVVPRDDAALAGALRRLLDDAGQRAALGAANRRKAEAEYSDTAMFAAWRDVWDG